MKDATGKDSGKKILSVDSLTSEIVGFAKAGEFNRAEKLRAHLLKHHPMALSEIIVTGETIEQQKSLRIDHEHLAIWELLYTTLTQEEKIGLFYATKKATVSTGKLLIRQGKPVDRLLFIDSGRVTLFHAKGDERILVGQVSRGDILGDETFFHLSNPTFSAGAQTDLSLRYLDKTQTVSWEDEYPGLYQKVADFCSKNSRSNLLIKQKNIEKRQFQRIKTDKKVTAYILGEEGARSGESYRGSLMDFSQNGGCFGIHCSRLETAQGLLGKRLELEFEVAEGGGGAMPKLQAMIVKLGILLYNDYSVHVRMDRELSPEDLKRYLQ